MTERRRSRRRSAAGRPGLKTLTDAAGRVSTAHQAVTFGPPPRQECGTTVAADSQPLSVAVRERIRRKRIVNGQFLLTTGRHDFRREDLWPQAPESATL